MKKYKMIILCLLMSAGLSTETFAVAFKLKNDASFTVRVRAYDRGEWRPWVKFAPGGWGDFAQKVERSSHTIQLEKWVGGGWERVYQGNHGSRMFTRVLQVVDAPDGSPLLAWWDERPGCRSMPPHPERGGSTCLKESGGWYWKTLYRAAKKIGQAYAAGQ